MELMIAIMFFAVASAVCVQLFVKAHLLSQQSSDLNMAVNQAQTAASFFKSTNGSPEAMAEQMGGTGEGETLVVTYDENWAPSSREQAVYVLRANIVHRGSLATGIITVEKQGDGQLQQLYQLNVSKYAQEGGAGNE